jgi:hypothetical protein
MISNAGPHPHQGQYSSDDSISRNPRAEQGRHGEKTQTVGDNLRWPDRVVVSCEDVEELSGREWHHFLLYSLRRPQRISRDDYDRRAGSPLQYAGCTLKAGKSVSQGMTEGTPRNDGQKRDHTYCEGDPRSERNKHYDYHDAGSLRPRISKHADCQRAWQQPNPQREHVGMRLSPNRPQALDQHDYARKKDQAVSRHGEKR